MPRRRPGQEAAPVPAPADVEAAGRPEGRFMSRVALAARLGVSVDFLWRRASRGGLWEMGEAGYHQAQAAIIEAHLAGALTAADAERLWAARLTLMRSACAADAS